MNRLAKSVGCIAVALAAALPAADRAEAIQLSGMGGYQFGGKVDVSGGDGLKLKDNPAFCAEIEIPLKFRTGMSLALLWDMQPTSLKIDNGAYDSVLTDVTLHYFQAGVLYNLKTDNPDLVPFTQGTLGATYVVPDRGESKTKFSLGFGAGLKYAVNPKVAIRLQGELFATMLTSDAWVGVGTGGANVSLGGNALLQGAIMGGVTLSLGGRKEQSETAPPPSSQPVMQQPPAQQPPAEQPPAQQPPAEQPPAQQPPAEQPPAEQPPAQQPPAAQPPATQPPATTPPGS